VETSTNEKKCSKIHIIWLQYYLYWAYLGPNTRSKKKLCVKLVSDRTSSPKSSMPIWADLLRDSGFVMITALCSSSTSTHWLCVCVRNCALIRVCSEISPVPSQGNQRKCSPGNTGSSTLPWNLLRGLVYALKPHGGENLNDGYIAKVIYQARFLVLQRNSYDGTKLDREHQTTLLI